MQAQSTAPYRRAFPASALGVRAEACLALASRYSDCRACVEACPVEAIAIADGEIAVEESCIACGRCAAVCPTEALAVEGFEIARPRDNTSIEIECASAPRDDGAAQARRVPCLQGVSVNHLLAWTLHTGAAVNVVERGCCTGCKGEDERAPLRDAVAETAALMAETGLPERLRPRVVEGARQRAKRTNAPAANAIAGGSATRRGFLGALARSTAAHASIFEDEAGEPPAPSHGRRTPDAFLAARRRRLALLRSLIERHVEGALPARLFPAVSIGADCSDHALCAALCPTDALTRHDDGATRGIDFDPERCIACGDCERACPSQAIALSGEGGGFEGPLIRHALENCQDCGRRFAAVSGEHRCQACRKSQALARDGVRQLLAAR